jgi:type I restriction enzyme S subunit
VFVFLDGQRVPVEVEARAERQGPYPYYGASGAIDSIDDFIFDEPLVLVCEDGWNLLLRTQPVARPLFEKAWVNNHAHVLRPRFGDVRYWAGALELTPFDLFVTGMRQPKLTNDALRGIPLPVPPPSESQDIGDHITALGNHTDSLVDKISTHVDRLREYRHALISAAVTGKLDIPAEMAS